MSLTFRIPQIPTLYVIAFYITYGFWKKYPVYIKEGFPGRMQKRILSCSKDFNFSSYITLISVCFTEDVIAFHTQPGRVKVAETIFNIRATAISLTVGLQTLGRQLN